MSKKNISRRSFLQAAAVTGTAGVLAACSGNSTDDSAATTVVPAADEYPIEPEEWGSGTVRHAEEVIGDERSGDGWTQVTNEDGPTLGVMDADKLIQVDGYAFKDLNGNGKLDLYEDWRQSVDDRSAALAAELTAEQIFPLLFNTAFFENGYPLGDQTLGILEEGARTTCNNGGYDASTSPEVVMWNNAIQKYCEENGGFGIPHMTSFDPYFKFGFPNNLALASTFDPENAQITGENMAKVWRSLGLHLYYGPQQGILTDPRWCRFSGGFSEDPALARDMVAGLINGLQSTYDENGEDLGWGVDSILCQTKHFPGGGAAEGGRYDHADSGKYNVYPGGGYEATFVSFIDGSMNLAGKTEKAGSFMPDYNIYLDADGDPIGDADGVGVAFDAEKCKIMRDVIGDNLVSSDWDITSNFDTPGQLREGGQNHAWGVEDLTPAEREAKALMAGGVDQFGGEFEPAIAADAYEIMKDEMGEDAALERLQECARRVFVAMGRVGLWENAYISREGTEAVVTDPTIAEKGLEVCKKAVIMLKNAGGVIQERSDKPTVYVPMMFSEAQPAGWMSEATPAGWSTAADLDLLGEYFNVVTDTVLDPSGEADAETGEATYTASDIERASADELAACDFALAYLNSPSTGNGYDDETQTYIPVSLQYREYTADGPNVRQVSISGNTLEDGTKENRSYYGQSVTATNESELDDLLAVKELLPEGLPLVVSVNMNNPMCFGEVEPSVDAIIATMGSGISDEAVLSVISGQYEPSGLLPAQMPKDMDAVEAQFEDLPRDMEVYTDSEGNDYDFAFGLNWSGVIDDERTAAYKVNPLTTPETYEL